MSTGCALQWTKPWLCYCCLTFGCLELTCLSWLRLCLYFISGNVGILVQVTLHSVISVSTLSLWTGARQSRFSSFNYMDFAHLLALVLLAGPHILLTTGMYFYQIVLVLIDSSVIWWACLFEMNTQLLNMQLCFSNSICSFIMLARMHIIAYTTC